MNSARREQIAFLLLKLSTLVGVLILVSVLIALIRTGGQVISWQFLSAAWQHQNIAGGGIFPAILGSIYIGMGVVLCSFPLGIGTAIYLTEYSQNRAANRIIELAIRNLAGVPSIIFGLFGLALFVNFLHLGTSILAAILTLSVMTLPWIITSTVEALQSVPRGFRESSLALGATPWQTIQRVTLPAAASGSITGGIVGIARAMGETAPIIVVGATFYLTRLPESPLDKFMALPYHTFILATQHADPRAQEFAAGSALVLILLTFTLSIGAMIARYSYRKKRDWL